MSDNLIQKNSWYYNLIIAFIFVFCSVSALAKERLGTLSTTVITPSLSTEILREWTRSRNIFEIDEVWIIENKEVFLSSLRSSGINDELFDRLTSRIRTKLSNAELANVISWHTLDELQGFLFLPKDLKKLLSPEVLRAAYTYLLQTKRASYFIKFNSISEASTILNKFGLRGAVLNEALAKTYEINERFYFFYTPDIWSKLTNELKIKLINFYTGNYEARRGLQVDFTFSKNDNIRGIAERYAGERDPAALERYLHLLLNRSQTGHVTIPLEHILHSFIRKNINTHTSCSGPNCFNAGVSVNEGNSFEQDFLRSEIDLLNEVYKKYRFVNPNEQLQTGDLFVYRNASGTIVHASTFITDDIVFTKNGLSRFNPYIFQLRTQNEAIYFPDGKYKLMVFRLQKSNEAPISPYGVQWFSGREIYYDDTVSPQSLELMQLPLERRLNSSFQLRATPSDDSAKRCSELILNAL